MKSTPRLRPWKLLNGRPTTLGTETPMSWLRSALVSDFFEAWVFSTMLMVRVSPM